MIFLITNWKNLLYLSVDPGFPPLPLNFCEASRFVPHRMNAPDRRNEQRDASLCPSVRLCLRCCLTITAVANAVGVKPLKSNWKTTPLNYPPFAPFAPFLVLCLLPFSLPCHYNIFYTFVLFSRLFIFSESLESTAIFIETLAQLYYINYCILYLWPMCLVSHVLRYYYCY